MRDPANRAESVALLIEKLKISGQEAERTDALPMDPAFGFTPDAIVSSSVSQSSAAAGLPNARANSRRTPAPYGSPRQGFMRNFGECASYR